MMTLVSDGFLARASRDPDRSGREPDPGRLASGRNKSPAPEGAIPGAGCGATPRITDGRPSGGIRDVMSAFNTRVQSDVLIVKFEAAAGLNDFRNNALRDALYELVQNRQSPLLAVDLQKVDYLSSSGVAILVGLKRRVDTHNGKIVFYHVQPVVRDLLGVMKLDRFFTITDEEDPALAALRPVPTA
jgi:anti-sigma B factor antagonist